MGLRRRPREPLPADVRDRLDLQRGDSVVGAGRLTDGWAVATLRGLQVIPDSPTAEDEPVAQHLRPWVLVDQAGLEAETAELTVTWVDGAAPTVLHLADDRALSLPRAIHDRVQSSVIHREAVTLPTGAKARVVVRRDVDGDLLTQVIGTGDVNLGDPETAAVVDAAEARVREAVGLR